TNSKTYTGHSLALSYNATATTEIYTLSLHDALPIFQKRCQQSGHGLLGERQPFRLVHVVGRVRLGPRRRGGGEGQQTPPTLEERSEEHTSELQSRENLVCRLLLEKKKRKQHDKCKLL